MSEPKNPDHIQINIRMETSNQEPPVSSKAPNRDLKEMDFLCTFKIKLVRPNMEHVYTLDQKLYTNQEKDVKIHSETSSLLQSPK